MKLGCIAGMALWTVSCLAHAQSSGAEAPTTLTESAADAGSAMPREKSWRLGVALGYGKRTNPLIQSEDIPVIVDLDFALFGERWFFDNFDLGFRLLDNPRFTTNAVARLNSDRAFFGKTNIRYVNFAIGPGGAMSAVATPPGANPGVARELKVPDRNYAVELGIETLLDGKWGQATLRVFHDVSGVHEGYEVSADYGFPWIRGRLSISPAVGIAYKSAALSDYYWGVHPDEVLPTLSGYRSSGGLDWEFGIRTSYYFTKRMRLALSANYERLHDGAARSPIVAEPQVVGYFAGLAWQF